MTHLIIDKQRALDEVDIDYSTMTEVADVLLHEAGVPFRIGHHYASELTSYGRAEGKRPKDLHDEELVRIYEESTGQDLPLDVGVIRQAMDPAAMVEGRSGLGGPQAEEVLRMLAGHNLSLEAGFEWLNASHERLVDSAAGLERNFLQLK
jgi:argininosuccinate lyase